MPRQFNQKKERRREKKTENKVKKLPPCDLFLKGICQKHNCNAMYHGRIVMNEGWICQHAMDYISELIRLENEHKLPFLNGGIIFLSSHKNDLSKIPIKSLFMLFKSNPKQARFISQILQLIPNGVDEFLSYADANFEPSIYDSIKIVLKNNKKCIADYPAMYQELQKKSLFSYVKRSAEEIQDSFLIALYESFTPSNRNLFLKKLISTYGTDFPVVERICNDHGLTIPEMSSRSSKFEDKIQQRFAILNDREDGYILPEDVSICYINSIHAFRMELTSMLQEKVLGWDSEWYAPFTNPVAPEILQISGEKRIWIIDGIWMRNLHSEKLDSLLSILLHSPILHVFKGSDDIRLLREFKEYPCFKDLKNCIDVDRILSHIGMTRCTLACECAFFLGKKLIKKETLTDWSQRPLEQNQLYYAALDAYVTRKIYLKAAYLILNEVPDVQIKQQMSDYAKAREYEKKDKVTFQYNITTSDSLNRYLTATATICDDYGW